LHVHACLKDQTGVNMQKEICRKQEIFTCKKQKNNKIQAITLRLQVIEIYSHQLLKYNWTDFSSKQRGSYFTKWSRWLDPTTQWAGFGPWAVCLTPLAYS